MKTKNAFASLALIAMTVSTASAKEGGMTGVGGGGDGVEDAKGSVALLDLVEPFEHDYFDARKYSRCGFGWLDYQYHINVAAGMTDHHEVRSYGPAVYLNRYISTLLLANSGLSSAPKQWSIEAPKPLIWIFTDEPLDQLRDEGLIRNIDPSTLVQVAVQKDGVVVVHKPSFERMNQKSREALFFHEMLVRLISVSNPDLIREKGTAPIRKFTKMFIERLFGGFVPEEPYRKAFQDLKIPDLGSEG